MSGTPRPRRRQRSAARRAAFHADNARKAATPIERLRAAEAYLTSEVAHSRSTRLANRQTADIAAHARHVLAEAPLSAASQRLHEAKLAAAGQSGGQAGLATALMVLRSAISRLPDARRDELADHYAEELTREARRIAHETTPTTTASTTPTATPTAISRTTPRR